MRKHSYKYVKNYFKEQACKLLEEEYINDKVKMEYICSCGEKSKISFNKFKSGRRCSKCAGNKKHMLKKVKQYFEDNNCKLLEKVYKNNKTKMKYICECKIKSEISFSNFRRGHRCGKCGIKKVSKKNKLCYEDVKQYFKKQKCDLLEIEYNGVHFPMKYRCSCGNVSKINFHNFKIGQRCLKCSNCGYSKESQKLFNAIYKNINKKYKSKTYYATLNNEFGINYNGKCFKYDYVNSKFKKAIEYNGTAWHPAPYLKNNAKNWHAHDKTKTAKEARSYEKIKYKGLEKRGYQILTVWDYDLHLNFDNLVKKCLDFLIS